jgi:hypothetical protein
MYKNAFFYHLMFLLIIVLITSCENKGTRRKPVKKSIRISNSKTNDYDTLITKPCAVLIYPTSHQIDSMQKKDSEDFYTAADDNEYYMYTSIKYLDSIKTKTIRRNAKGSLAFRTSDGQLFKEKIDTLYWNIILFNGKTKPKLADITSIQEDYNTYMK